MSIGKSVIGPTNLASLCRGVQLNHNPYDGQAVKEMPGVPKSSSERLITRTSGQIGFASQTHSILGEGGRASPMNVANHSACQVSHAR